MMKLLNILILFLFACLSCTPKVMEEVVEEPVKEIEIPSEPENPCVTFSRLNASERDQAETAYVLYKDFYDAKEFDRALPLWIKAYQLAPAANGRVKYQFDHGVTMYTELYKSTTDASTKKAYLDTIFMIYDKRVECFGDPAYISGRKAYDMYYNFYNEFTDLEKFENFKAALDGKGEKADYFIINPMTKLLYDNYQSGAISKEETKIYAVKLLNAINYGTKNCDKDCEAWEVVNSYAPARLEAFEAEKNFYDCDYYTDKYYSSFEASQSDCENILFVSRRMIRGGCDQNGEKLMALKNAYKTNCYTPPPPPGPCATANKLYNEGKYKEAIAKFEECLANGDNEKKAKYKLLIAKIYYRDLKSFSKSRKYALEAASLKANWGEPYMLIGKLYASSGPLCGPGTGWDSQIVTWPAIDKWKYAKKIDSSAAAEANKLINQYTQYMPKKEDVFIRSLKAGQSYKVGCWIQETTKIRTAD